MYPESVSSVYVEMFDTSNFRRGHEYDLTDAICKRIESETPYKIVSDRNIADSVLSGDIIVIDSRRLAVDRDTGRNIEDEVLRVDDITLDVGKHRMTIDGKSLDVSPTEFKLMHFFIN